MFRVDELRSALIGPYAALDVVETTGSTNADLVASVAAADRTVLIAGAQTAGRGRRAREWASPPSGLYLSVLLRPGAVPVARWGTLAMVAGVALVQTAADVGVDAALKWPNDLLVAGGKCAGVLSEAAGTAVIVGIGLNVSPLGDAVPLGPGALPAVSLAEAGATTTDRTDLAIALLGRFASVEAAWRDAAGDIEASGILATYLENCATIGQDVRVELGDSTLSGRATTITPTGELVITAPDSTEHPVSAGDVVHLRG
jgi:BirA family biotin operon repressor/biotin-[acetyl-CoA-carboxylase] ligase